MVGSIQDLILNWSMKLNGSEMNQKGTEQLSFIQQHRPKILMIEHGVLTIFGTIMRVNIMLIHHKITTKVLSMDLS